MTRDSAIDKQSKLYAKNREKCGLVDPITLDEIECAFYSGGIWADEHPNWISVEDELPPYGMQVLVYSEQNIEYEMWFSKRYTAEDAILLGADGTKWCEVITDKNGFCTLRDKLNVTHWRNIEPPRKENEL